jgi:hypothetical protein
MCEWFELELKCVNRLRQEMRFTSKNKIIMACRTVVGDIPLQLLMTSNPIICTTTVNSTHSASHDTMLLVLYGCNMQLIEGLIEMFSNNILQSNRSTGEEFTLKLNKMVAAKSQGLDYARAVFLLLLNIDETAKQWVCNGFPNAKIGSLSGLKAPGFFTALAHDVVPNWQRDESKSVQNLVHRARSAYLVA